MLLAPSLRVTLSTGQRVLLITAKDRVKQFKVPGPPQEDPGRSTYLYTRCDAQLLFMRSACISAAALA